MNNLEQGVFAFFCAKNEHMYLGASEDIPSTVDSLVADLRQNRAYDRNLQTDWNHHGEEEFDISTLEELEDATPQTLQTLLQRWLVRIPFAKKLALSEEDK